MSEITCYHCFSRFGVRQLCFKCVMHKEGPRIFPWQPGPFEKRPPRYAECPDDHLLTGFRVCPNPDCHADLPYYVGRSPQRLVSVVGCRATGKTIYLWGLLHQLTRDLARSPRPYAAAMFENDESFRAFQTLDLSLRVGHMMPDATQAEEMRLGTSRPLVVRVLSNRPGAGFCNLILYDPAGELLENLEEVRFLRYVSGSSAIIYLMDLPANLPPGLGEEHVSLTCLGLNSVIHQIRREHQMPIHRRLPQSLAVVLTKCDETLFARDRPEGWVAGLSQGQDFWLRWDRLARQEVDEVSGRCERFLGEQGYAALVALAKHNFDSVRFFAVSSLGVAPRKGLLPVEPRPVGVENPLFWIFNTLK